MASFLLFLRLRVGKIVHTFLSYGFVIALVVIVLGFALQWYRVSQDGRGTRDVVAGVKPALISIFNTRAVKDPDRRRTQIELTFKNTGEIETVGYIDSFLLVNGVDRKSGTLPPKQLTFAPNQPVTLVLYLSNRSEQGSDDIWSGRHPVEARVRLKFHAMPSQERTYLYRGDDPSINTLQSDYVDGFSAACDLFPPSKLRPVNAGLGRK